MMSRDAAALMSTGLLCVVLPACGATGLHAVRLLGAAPAAPATIEVDRVRYDVAVADQWIRVAVHNLSDDTLYLDVGGLVFSNSADVRHRLVASGLLTRFEASADRIGVSPEFAALHARDVHPAPAGHRPARVALRLLPAEPPPVRIPPGRSHEDYFYPAEHLVFASSGRWSAGPLFCELRGDDPEGADFEVAIPLRDGRAVHRVLLAGRVEPGPASPRR